MKLKTNVEIIVSKNEINTLKEIREFYKNNRNILGLFDFSMFTDAIINANERDIYAVGKLIKLSVVDNELEVNNE